MTDPQPLRHVRNMTDRERRDGLAAIIRAAEKARDVADHERVMDRLRCKYPAFAARAAAARREG